MPVQGQVQLVSSRHVVCLFALLLQCKYWLFIVLGVEINFRHKGEVVKVTVRNRNRVLKVTGSTTLASHSIWVGVA